MIYTYRNETGPAMLRALMELLMSSVFQRQTRKRLASMHTLLLVHRAPIEAWQRSGGGHENNGLRG